MNEKKIIKLYKELNKIKKIILINKSFNYVFFSWE